VGATGEVLEPGTDADGVLSGAGSLAPAERHSPKPRASETAVLSSTKQREREGEREDVRTAERTGVRVESVSLADGSS